jgi:hypothetical protein
MILKEISDTLKAKAIKSLEFTQIAYKDFNEEYEEYEISNINNSQDIKIEKKQVFVIYSNELDADEFAYRSAVFIDNDTKEVVIANAGTRPGLDSKGFYDLTDDLRLALDMEPLKIEQAKQVNKRIIDLLGDDIQNYNFSYTGHSLGAAIADMQAAHMDVELQERKIEVKGITTTTFDNPGAGKLVKKIYENASMNSNVRFNAFNNRENFINTLAHQAGELFEITPDDQKYFSQIEKLVAFIANFICKKLENWDAKYIIKICKLFSFGSLETQLNGHKLSNFTKFFVAKQGDVTLKNQASRPEIASITEEMHKGLNNYIINQQEPNKEPLNTKPLTII